MAQLLHFLDILAIFLSMISLSTLSPVHPHVHRSTKTPTAQDDGVGGVGQILGEWTSIAGWTLVVYCSASIFLFIWLWSAGWIDNKLEPTARCWGLRSTTAHLYRDRPLPPLPMYATSEHRHYDALDEELRRLGLV